MRAMLIGVLAVGAISLVLVANAASAAQVVPWALRTTVDSDGDSTPDLFDNAPGAANNQADADADLIGDVIDPTPNGSNPSLGDPFLGMNGPHTIAAGAHVFVDYLMLSFEPPGQWGHIDLDFGGNGVYDATYFGPLTFSLNQIDVPPALFVDPTWNLNVPGSYVLHALAYGPGSSSQNYTISGAIVTPEPATVALLAIAGFVAIACRRGPSYR